MLVRTGLTFFPLAFLTIGCSRQDSPQNVPRERQLEATPGYYANIAYQRGSQYLAKGDYEAAEASYEKAVAYNPELAPAHSDLGYIHYVKGNYEEAEEKFKKTIEIDSTYVGAYFYLGKLYDRKGMVDRAIEQYEKAVRILPEYAAAHFFLGKDYEKKGLVKKALGAYRNYLRFAPDGDGARQSREAIERLRR